MAAEIWNIEEVRERRIRNLQNKTARPFWGADGEEIHTAFERAMAPETDGQRALVARLASHWEAVSVKERRNAAKEQVASLPPAA